MDLVKELLYEEDGLGSILRHIRLQGGFKIVSKEDSTLMKVIGKLMFWNKRFMRMTTTIGDTVYISESLYKLLVKGGKIRKKRFLFGMLLHEAMHMSDRRRMGTLKYRLKYLSPQIYSLGALLALLTPFSSWFLLALGFLVFAAPWPSQGRTEIEANGYEMGAAVEYWMTGKVSIENLVKIHIAFTSMKYYKMCPGYVTRVLPRFAFGKAAGSNRNYFLGDPRLRKAYKALLTAGMVHESVAEEYHMEAIKYYEQAGD